MKTVDDTLLVRRRARRGFPRLDFASSLPPTLQQRYEVGPLIGRGSEAELYEGRQIPLERPVSIKVLSPLDGIITDAMQERFFREATIFAKLNHSNIVTVFDYGETDDGLLYVVMESISGTLLSDVITGSPLEDLQALAIGYQIAGALGALQQSSLRHLDLKPSNMMVFERPGRAGFGTVKLWDFDIAECFGRKPSAIERHRFMAPERFDGAPVDASAEVYAFGVLLYMLFAGKPPFDGETLEELSEQHRTTPVPRLGEWGHARTPLPEVEAVVDRCLAKQPEGRYASAFEVQKSLQSCLAALSEDGPLLQGLYDRPPRLGSLLSPRPVTPAVDPLDPLDPLGRPEATRATPKVRRGSSGAEPMAWPNAAGSKVNSEAVVLWKIWATVCLLFVPLLTVGVWMWLTVEPPPPVKGMIVDVPSVVADGAESEPAR